MGKILDDIEKVTDKLIATMNTSELTMAGDLIASGVLFTSILKRALSIFPDHKIGTNEALRMNAMIELIDEFVADGLSVTNIIENIYYGENKTDIEVNND